MNSYSNNFPITLPTTPFCCLLTFDCITELPVLFYFSCHSFRSLLHSYFFIHLFFYSYVTVSHTVFRFQFFTALLFELTDMSFVFKTSTTPRKLIFIKVKNYFIFDKINSSAEDDERIPEVESLYSINQVTQFLGRTILLSSSNTSRTYLVGGLWTSIICSSK